MQLGTASARMRHRWSGDATINLAGIATQFARRAADVIGY